MILLIIYNNNTNGKIEDHQKLRLQHCTVLQVLYWDISPKY